MIAIVDYKAGNLTSVSNALTSLGIANRVTGNAEEILSAERVIFPGVGAAQAAMSHLCASGLDRVLHRVAAAGTPLLGICLGTQIILQHSQEDGGVECVGLLPGEVIRFRSEPGISIPHMGWNQVDYRRPHPVFAGIPDGTNFYFVHSFYPEPSALEDRIATTSLGSQTFVSALGRGNVVATQFHPEKSGEPGLRLLKNFASWSPSC